jgi:hypothetical protein
VKRERPPLPLVIAQLARDAAPVEPLPSPLARWCAWTLSAIVAGVIVTILLGFLPRLRPVVAAPVHDPRFVLAALATGGLALLAAGAAFALSVPGAARGRFVRIVPWLAAIAWAAVLRTRLVAIGDPVAQIVTTPWHPVCVLLILTISALPGFWLFLMLRRAAPLQSLWTGALAALGTLALGALGTQFVCPIDAPAHHLVWHFSPVIVLSALGLVLGARVFDWRRRGAGTFRRLP